MADNNKKCEIAIIGAGLVGCLNACFLARKGYTISLYEMREDQTETQVATEYGKGRSINLTLSYRGKEALKHIKLDKEIINKYTIPVYGRLVHDVSGKLRKVPYGKSDEFISSIDRRTLNKVLLEEVKKHKNVTCYFDHKLVQCDIEKGGITLEQTKNGDKIYKKTNLIIGTDGAHSVVRQQIMKETNMNYQQEYIQHGYMELIIPATASGEFAMESEVLHLWPRDEFMMIALPNLDRSYTCSLFMPFDIFDSILLAEDFFKFFKENFGDVVPLIGEQKLKETFENNKVYPMISIKCSPHHMKDRAIIMGDAAHAMVPFFGQGANTGFEDCLVLEEMIEKHDDIGTALQKYNENRCTDAQVICDLAMNNYIEMRRTVNTRRFRLRKTVDTVLHTLFPRSWIPLYTMVAFSRERFQVCKEKKQKQDQIIRRTLQISVAALITGGCLFFKRRLTKISTHFK